jgi:hypothetical protein
MTPPVEKDEPYLETSSISAKAANRPIAPLYR